MVKSGSRQGAVIVMALICLVITASMVGVLLRRVLGQHRQVRRHQQQLQAAWLAESAIQRGATRLRADRDYAGETWQVPARALSGTDSGQVMIRIGPRADGHARHEIEAIADFPAAGPPRARFRKRVTIELLSLGESP